MKEIITAIDWIYTALIVFFVEAAFALLVLFKHASAKLLLIGPAYVAVLLVISTVCWLVKKFK